MPFICLTQALPDGTVNILDLAPNTSLKSAIYDGPGQTKYVNRAQNDTVLVSPTGVTLSESKGVGAYLVDRVEVGGTQTATGTITCLTVLATDEVTIAGVVFTAVDGGAANPAVQAFDSKLGAGTDQATSDSLVATINNGASQALIVLATGGPTVTATNAGGTSTTVTLTASLVGPTGDLALTTNSALTCILSGATMTRTNSAWTPTTLATATAALFTRMDGGLALALANVNAILGVVGGELTATTTNSTGVLLELLSILSGRGYTLPAGVTTFTGTTFNTAQGGSFTEGVLTFDTEFNASPNGTIVQREYKPIRTTYDSGSLQESALLGQLFRFANGVTLWPDSDLLPPITGQQAPVTGRLITVYADDGTVIV